MKKMLFAAMLAVSVFTVAVSDADAKRLGGGSSFGKQSQSLSRPAPAPSGMPSQAARPATPPPAAAPAPIVKPPSPWRGILGGALLGLGMGALFSHFGMGGAMGSLFGTILMFGLLALAVMFIVRMFRRKQAETQTPAFAGNAGYINEVPREAPYAQAYTPEIGSRIEPSNAALSAPVAPAVPFGIPAGFDVPAFLRNAKIYFIRLQAAWDRADSSDIREFTSPEMFAELKMQLQERGASPNTTDVINLEATLLGIEENADFHLASVKFSGLIKEAPDVAAEPFTEVWNLSKPTTGTGGWVLAGIQQLS
jgi:predicted lipid-binding transport protein (Tim44 family)